MKRGERSDERGTDYDTRLKKEEVRLLDGGFT